MSFSSLAPRFIGEFQKGIDYRGNVNMLETSLRIHGAIARYFGLRLSIHSGSDKFSVFPHIGRQTKHRYHLKIAGASWLQVLRVVAQHDPLLSRSLYAYSLEAFIIARTYYSVTPEVEMMPDLTTMRDEELDQVFDNPDCRQVMHISYGEILKDSAMKKRLYDCLHQNIEAYWHSLEEHIGRHLELLGVLKR